MHISGTEPSSVILSQTKEFKNIEKSKRDFYLDVYTILNRI